MICGNRQSHNAGISGTIKPQHKNPPQNHKQSPNQNLKPAIQNIKSFTLKPAITTQNYTLPPKYIFLHLHFFPGVSLLYKVQSIQSTKRSTFH